ncbi:MAG: hypothetical protein VYE73_13390 [Acidobacteriota bacterium]|nr:hypothetical protein [Acidobacteriota bacterium]
MSLGAVHILFITICTVLAVGTGSWGLRGFVADGSILGLVYGLLSLVAVPVLMTYGVRVRRKLKELPR